MCLILPKEPSLLNRPGNHLNPTAQQGARASAVPSNLHSVRMSSPDADVDPVQKMNRMYRWTRHVYDASRRYYLLGRNEMLEQISDLPPSAVLEVGCGTARNLRMLDDTAPQHTLYGIDASPSMLATARTKLERAGCANRITLGHGLAQELAPRDQLGVDRTFDVLLFSYVLSMIPSWPSALRSALCHLSPGGRLHIVDFWDQVNLPSWLATLLQRWLAFFDVYPRPDLIRTLYKLDCIDGLSCTIEPVARRYAYRATINLDGRVPPAAFEVLGGREPSPSWAADPKRFDRSTFIPG